MVLAPVTAAAFVVAVFVAPALNRERIPADERAVPSQTVSPTPRAMDPSPIAGSFSEYGPVDATVYVSGHRQVTINKGLDDGIHRGDPVIDGAGLVGTVAKATGGSAVVTLITDQSFATSVYAGQRRHPGSITTATEPSGDLLFEPVDADASVRMDDLVYTAGTTDLAVPSRYPRAIPLGRVSRIDLGDGDLDRRIYVKPAADLPRLGKVQVLTDPHAELEAKAPTSTAALDDVEEQLAAVYGVFRRSPRATDQLPEQPLGARRLEVDWSRSRRIATLGERSAFAVPTADRGRPGLCVMTRLTPKAGAGGGCGFFTVSKANSRPNWSKTDLGGRRGAVYTLLLPDGVQRVAIHHSDGSVVTRAVQDNGLLYEGRGVRRFVWRDANGKQHARSAGS